MPFLVASYTSNFWRVLIGSCNFRGSYIQGGLKPEWKMSFETRYSGADQNTFCIHWFYIKLQNVIDNK